VAPAVWIVLTTRSTDIEPAVFYRAREKLWKSIKRRYPNAEYAALVEFSTGYGPASGGLRRPHWNLLVKGVSATETDSLRALVDRVWCGRVDAEPAGQFVGAVSELGGLMRYIALHFQKASQRPPDGWRGHRFMTSRGYFGVTSAVMRDRARSALLRRRELWKARQRLGDVDAELLELEAAAGVARAEALSWELWAVSWSPAAPDVFRPERALPPRRKQRRPIRVGSGRRGSVLTARARRVERPPPGVLSAS
jgi:hypothetical protein